MLRANFYVERDRGFADSPLEGDGFEPSVPGRETVRGDGTKLSKMGANQLGTEGSNPSPSSGESSKLASTSLC
jgi:hypothetical protein